MPTYDYRCPSCGRFEKVQKITEASLEVCPTCGGPVERLIGGNIGVVLKGSGFYRNDKNFKDQVRSYNKERQVDNQAILDGDVKGFVEQSDATTKKILES